MLNTDQKRAVALVARPMQAAWEKSRDAERSQTMQALLGTRVRLLLVGGGGCGKTRIINKVLVPLLEAFYGSQGVLEEASSHKAARLLHGKTIHAANKFNGGSSLRTLHLRLNERRAKVLEEH